MKWFPNKYFALSLFLHSNIEVTSGLYFIKRVNVNIENV